MKQKWFNIGLTVVVVAALAIGFFAFREVETQYQTMALPGDVSNFSGVHIAAPTAMAAGTPGLLVDCAGANNCLEVRIDATPVAYYDSSGNYIATGTRTEGSTLDMNGNKIDLDVDADTSITADTDDQIDLEIGGADIVVFKEWGADTITSSTVEHLFEIQDGAPVMTAGTNSLAAINIDLDIGNSTAGTNAVYGVLIDNIVGDAEVTETAFDIAGTGWDVGLGMGGNCIDLDANDNTSICADTDDQIDIEISGSDDFRFTANTFTILGGSKINSAAVATGTHGITFVCSGAHGHASAETAVEICSLPANANVVDVAYLITTDWNDSSSATVDCGLQGGDTDAFLDGTDLNTVGDNTFARMGSGATYPAHTSLVDVGAADINVVCQVAEGTNDASEGAATLYVWYIID